MPHVIIGTLLILIIITAGWLICFYNKLANIKSLVDESWNQLYLQLNKRNKLILEYVDLVFGFDSHHTLFLMQIMQARSNLIESNSTKDIMKYAGEISNILIKFFSVNELCSELKKQENYLLLKQQLTELEEQIEVCRFIYNEKVLEFNKFINKISHKVSGGILGIKELPYI